MSEELFLTDKELREARASVAALTQKLRNTEAIAEARLRDLNSAGDALYSTGYKDEDQPLWADIAKLAGERDAAKAEVERMRSGKAPAVASWYFSRLEPSGTILAIAAGSSWRSPSCAWAPSSVSGVRS